jgi:hypothetical protein
MRLISIQMVGLGTTVGEGASVSILFWALEASAWSLSICRATDRQGNLEISADTFVEEAASRTVRDQLQH